MKKILLIEDEDDIRELVKIQISKEDILVDEAKDGNEAYDKILKNRYDLIVMDWMIPKISGLEIVSWIRKLGIEHKDVPILMLTAKSDPEDIVLGLEVGADDYVVKPFDFDVLNARIKNLLKRDISVIKSQSSEGKKTESILRMGDLVLDKDSHQAKLRGDNLNLTYSELRLLEALIFNQGKVLSRKAILKFIQGRDVVATGRTIDTHISILRKKLKDYGDKIETIRNVGYRIIV